jgi:hypothetical protein
MANARAALIRKSDLTPAFEAAKAAGYEHVSVTVDTADGRRFHIAAGIAPDAAQAEMSPLQKWKAGHASK